MVRLNHFLKNIRKKEVKLNYILQILRIKRSGFFELLTRYRKDPDNFSIQYKRNTSHYRINPLHERIQLRIVPDKESSLSEVRFWYKNELLSIQKVKNNELNLVQF